MSCVILMIFSSEGPQRRSISKIWKHCWGDLSMRALSWRNPNAPFYRHQWSIWAIALMERDSTLRQEGEGCATGTQAFQPTEAPIIPWAGAILWKVCTKLGYPAQPSSLTPPQECQVVLDRGMWKGLQRGQGGPIFCYCLGTLWPPATSPSGCWCLLLWGGCSYFSCLLRWFWTTNCICLQITDNQWEILFTVGERGPFSCVWCSKISSVPLWEEIHLIHWPQATHIHPGAKEGCPFTGSSPVTVLGFVTVCLQLSDWMQIYPGPQQCRWPLQTTTIFRLFIFLLPMQSVVILTFLSFDKLRHFLSLPCSSKQQALQQNAMT